MGGERNDGARPEPGLVLLFAGGHARCTVIPLHDDVLVLGREQPVTGVPPDARMSRRHAEVRWDGERFCVRDLGSRNGTFVDGQPAFGQIAGAGLRILRAGSSLFLLCQDVEPFRSCGVSRSEDLVMGPSLASAWKSLACHARAGSSLFLRGESGAGKEEAVRAFHALGPRAGQPLVAVNCGAIPESMAERLLFGTRRGAYSGASSDAPGYVQAANGGILFLDEVAELMPSVQAKLLRVLESKEVLALGATRPQRVDFVLCAATHKDLHTEVAEGRFRQDLYFRLGRPEVCLPPLRARIEEIPWLIDMAIERMQPAPGAAQATPDREAPASMERNGEPLAVTTSFVEACMLRTWPGNVRELLIEVRAAAYEALAAGSKSLAVAHLAPHAGEGFPEAAGRPPRGRPERMVIEAALREHRGNISAAARALGVHRTQLRRWLDRDGIDAGSFAGPPA